MDDVMVDTAKINGTELAYLERGQGQPVVFVRTVPSLFPAQRR